MRWRCVLHVLALLALPVGVAAIVVGTKDAVFAAAPVPRLVGLLLMACGVALVAAASLVVRYTLSATHPTEHRWVVPVLFLAGAIPGLLLFILQVSAYIFNWRLFVWLAAFLVPVVAAVAVLRASGAGEARRVWGRVWQSYQSPAAKLVASLLSAGVVLGVWQTLLSYYAPVKRGDSLSVTTSVVPAEQHVYSLKKEGDVEALHGTVYMENAGEAKLVILACIYLLTGESVPLRSPAAQTELLQRTLQREVSDPGEQGVTGVGRYEARPKISLVKTGIVYDPGSSWIAPGTKAEIHFLAYAPKKQFTRYIFTVQVIAARADRMELGALPTNRPTQSPGQSGGIASVTATRRIIEASSVNELIRGTRHIFVNYSIPTDQILTERTLLWPPLTACVAFKQSECVGKSKSRLRERDRWRASYGVNMFPAWYSLEMPTKP